MNTRRLLAAAVTLADAVETHAPANFQDAALRELWAAACEAAGIENPADLPAELFQWGPTVPNNEQDRQRANAEAEHYAHALRLWRE